MARKIFGWKKWSHKDVRLRIGYCGICGTDIHEYLGGPIFPPAAGQKNPHTGLELPITLGHEFSGTIVEVGSAVKGLELGQEVAVNPSVDDRHHGVSPCNSCKAGKPNICKRWCCYGLSAPGGGLSDEIVIKSCSAIPLPAGVSLKAGALAEPFAVAHHMIDLAGFEKGDNVLVLGAGPIGLALLLLLKSQGAAAVYVSEVTKKRGQKALEFGADNVINPLNNSGKDGTDLVLEYVRQATEDGVDVAFDATGIQATLDTAIAATRPGGTVFNVAIHEKALSVNPNDIFLREKRYLGGICYTNKDFEAVLKVMADGSLKAEDLISADVPLENAVSGAFEELINHKEEHVKILVHP